MTTNEYPNLFREIKLAGHTIGNRCIMGSMHTGLEEEKDGFEKMAAFYQARASGGVGLIITGGIAPHWRGWVAPFSGKLTTRKEVNKHRIVTRSVHEAKGKIAMQILHAGRYSYHPFSAAPSRIKAPISPFTPFALSSWGVRRTVDCFARCASLARDAGYDGVEIMGSEGYLINQFLAPRTNKRRDLYGGDFEGRSRFALQTVRKIREVCGPDFIIVFRLSLLDLVENGSTWQEVVMLAKALEAEGVDLINTGIGWHEARIPTIATCVPRGAYTWITGRLRAEVDVPLAAVNRINTPALAEQILSDGVADMVTLARPLLADAQFMQKAAAGESDLINSCIACNQACLDHVFKQKRATCLVNPRACYELEYPAERALKKQKQVAVVGGGPAGMAAAVFAAERGVKVTLYEAKDHLGGQFSLARLIPGKEEFSETLRYFERQLSRLAVEVKLNARVSAETFDVSRYDAILVASGVKPRHLQIPGIESNRVVYYDQAIAQADRIGGRVAVIGSGGIGIDFVSLLVARRHPKLSLDTDQFLSYWGIDTNYTHRGGLLKTPNLHSSGDAKITIFQRSSGRPGRGLGKTTAWIHRMHLKREGVEFLNGVEYLKIDDDGLHYRTTQGDQVFSCDHVVVCAGQVSQLAGLEFLKGRQNVHFVGGALKAAGIDAKRAIRESFDWAQRLE